ncbi:MAG: 6,7-dimethyl-8-ribityllumazine synthase [Verrucomicrobiales bacterium]
MIASLYNEQYVNAMLEAAKTELLELSPNCSVPLYRVPGAWEIPVTAEFVARRTAANVIIALGVVIRGQTGHADLICQASAKELQEVATRHTIPVINEILLVEDERQAHARCMGTRLNRGVEAARAAAGMAELFTKLEEAYPEAAENTRFKKQHG